MALKWERCSKQWRTPHRESKYGERVLLKTGAVTPVLRKDKLARAADREFERWWKTLSSDQQKELD